MTDELDLDAFPGVPLEAHQYPHAGVLCAMPDCPGYVRAQPAPERRADEAVKAAIAAEREAMSQMTLEPEAKVPPKDVTPVREHLRALIYASKSGGDPHIVTLHETKDGQAVLCRCEATLNLARRPQGCWAMVDAREVFGLAAVGGN